MVRHMYSNIFRGACPKAHILLHRTVNTFTTESNLPASRSNLNSPQSNPTPYYTTLQSRTPHSPPLSQHRHPFSTFPTNIISATPPKHPSLSPHSVSQQGRKELSKALLGIHGGSSTGTSRRFCIEVVGWLGAKSARKLIVCLD